MKTLARKAVREAARNVWPLLVVFLGGFGLFALIAIAIMTASAIGPNAERPFVEVSP